MNEVVGHKKQRAMLARLVATGKLPHAMMLAGSPGIGKALIAKTIALAGLCEESGEKTKNSKAEFVEGCGLCATCRRIASGNCPDFVSIDCADRERWKLEQLREFIYSLNLRAFGGGRRYVIFDNAEELPVQAANVLLKTLEEPRNDTFFILVCANSSRLPRTLVSRCQVWLFDQLSNEEVRSILRRKRDLGELPKELPMGLDELAALADGSVGSIEQLINAFPAWQKLQTEVAAMFKGSIDRGLELAQDLGKERDSLRSHLNLLRTLARKGMQEEHEPFAKSRWSVLLCELISAERYIFERNLGASYVLSHVFVQFASSQSPSIFTGAPANATLLEKISV